MFQLSIDGSEVAYRKLVHEIEEHGGEREIQLIGVFLDFCVAPPRRLYSWAMPNEEALRCVVHHSKTCAGIVEVGAGTGFWAALLASLGVDVLAFDKAPPHCNVEGETWPLNTQHSLHAKFAFLATKKNGNVHQKKTVAESNCNFIRRNNTGCFFPVRRGGAVDAGLHPEYLLFLCWPPAWSVTPCSRLLITCGCKHKTYLHDFAGLLPPMIQGQRR